MKPKVVCKHCKTVLEIGDIGGGEEQKVCYDCVIATTKGSPKNRLLRPDKVKLESLGDGPAVMNRAQRRKQKPLGLDLYYKWFSPDENCPVEQLRWILGVKTYEKKTLMEVTFSKEDLMEVIKDMETYENERLIDNAGSTPDPA